MRDLSNDFFRIIFSLKDSLNELHEVDKDSRYWGVVLFSFVIEILHSNVDKERVYFDYTDLITKSDNRYTFSFQKNSIIRNLNIAAEASGEARGRVLFDYLRFYLFNRRSFSKKREKLKLLLKRAPSNVLLTKAMPLPKVYVEYFNFFAKFNFKSDDPMVSYSLKNARGIIYANRCDGNKIYLYQHGGFYGEIKNHLSYRIEYMLSDRFYTWGWSYNDKDYPWYSSRLHKFTKLYNAANVKEEHSGLDLLFLPPLFDRYNNIITFFLKQIIENKLQDQIYIRPYTIRRDINGKLYEEVNALFRKSNLNTVSRISNYAAIKSCQIVLLINHPSTTFLECISVDHPILVFIPDDTVFCDEIKVYIDFFREQKIMFFSLQEMLSTYISNRSLILQNWCHLIESDIYLRFKAKYANSKELIEI